MSNASPYLNSYGISYENGDTSLERLPYTYIKGINDLVHTVIEGETLQSISFRYYKDSGLWYVISDTNDIYNPFSELIPGMELLIPNGRQ